MAWEEAQKRALCPKRQFKEEGVISCEVLLISQISQGEN